MPTRVLALPSWELFDQQSQEYIDDVLGPADALRVAVEAASPLGWHKWIGRDGLTLTVDRFGACGQGEETLDLFGFTGEHLTEAIRNALQQP